MESVDQTIDRVFPKVFPVRERCTMEDLATMKTNLKRSLPPDSTVELTLLMNTICLSVWVPGEGNKWHSRQCEVTTGAKS